VPTDDDYMREAIRVMTEDGALPAFSPIGSVIVMYNRILAARRNRVAEHHDATAHADQFPATVYLSIAADLDALVALTRAEVGLHEGQLYDTE